MSIYKYKMVNDKKVELTADEIKELEARDVEWAKGELDRQLDAIRQVREPLLLEADWQINKLNDSKGDASKWIAYRIKLRDITKDVDTVDKAKAVTMPKKP
jgi:hypothetical protein